MMPPASRKRLATWAMAAATLLLAVLAPAAAQADEIVVNGVHQRNVRITGLRQRFVLYETATGVRRQAELSDVQELSLSRYDGVGEAESLAREGNHVEAAARYAAAIEQMREGEVKALVRMRYIATLERAGEREEAVRQYLELVEANQSPAALAARPTRLPREAEPRQRLAELVRARQRRTGDALARRALGQLAEALAAEPSEEDTETMEQPADANAEPASQGRAAGEPEDAIDRLITAGRHDAALNAVNDAIAERDGTLVRRLHQRGRILAQLGRPREAALSLMRIIIHFPGSNGYYVPSLIEAGRLFVELDQPEHARRLWQEAQRARGVSDTQLEEIDQLLGRLP